MFLTGAVTFEEILVTPTMKRSSRGTEIEKSKRRDKCISINASFNSFKYDNANSSIEVGDGYVGTVSCFSIGVQARFLYTVYIATRNCKTLTLLARLQLHTCTSCRT